MKKFLLIVLFIALTLYQFGKPLLSYYASLFDVSGYTGGADGVVLLAGNPETRMEKAVELYQGGSADHIYLSTTRPMGNRYPQIFKDQTRQVLEVLTLEGISDYTVIPSLKGGATSTFDEAYDVAHYAKDHNLSHLIIVTDKFHTARALYAFKKVFRKLGVTCKLEAAGAKNNHFNRSNWWLSEAGLSSFILEPIKFFVYLFRSSNLEMIEATP